jgi:hypothetical protein
MRTALQICTWFNWLWAPAVILQTIRNADNHNPFTGTYPIFLDANSPWAGDKVLNLLRQKGVPAWGLGYMLGEVFFSVKRSQAGLALLLLRKANVLLLH